MSPITHFLASWTLAEAFVADRRARICITLAGVAPDLDGLGVVADVANRWLGRPQTDYFSQYHHFLLHGALGAILAIVICAGFIPRRWPELLLVFFSVHLHLLCDLVGAHGPGPDENWPIQYFAPFSHVWTFSWSGQWKLNAWPNMLLTAILIGWSVARAVTRGVSPVSIFSPRIDAVVVQTLQQRWASLSGKSLAQ